MPYYIPAIQGFDHTDYGNQPPAGYVYISEADFAALFAQVSTIPGGRIVPNADGRPVVEVPTTTAADLCRAIDSAADIARAAVAGDPLRAVEYDRARLEAEAFAAADYQGEVPRMVAAWALNGRNVRQAADSILAEAAAYTEALYTLREARLQAKEQIRTAFAAGNVELAEDIAAETVAAIEAAVQGVGNAQA